MTAVPIATAAIVGPASELSLVDSVRLLSLDQGLLLAIAVVGLTRHGEDTSVGLVLGGASGVLGALLVSGTDAWCAHALYRIGLVLAASGPLVGVLEEAGDWLRSRRSGLQASGAEASRLGLASLLLLVAPASFVTWWDPSNTDLAFDASREPFPGALEDAMRWIRENTSPGSVILASELYSPAVGVLAGRRILRAPGLYESADEARRADAERRLLRQRNLRDWVFRYGVGYVFVAPGDFTAFGIRRPEDLASRPGFRLVYSNWEGYRVYELVR
jgi:hypothetical protein